MCMGLIGRAGPVRNPYGLEHTFSCGVRASFGARAKFCGLFDKNMSVQPC